MKKLFLACLLTFLLTVPAFGALHLHWVAGERVWYDGTENIFWIRTASEGLRIGDNLPFHFGDDDDSYIKYVSSTDTLQISATTIQLSGSTQAKEVPTLAKTEDYTVLTSDFGKSIRVTSTSTVTMTLPSVGSGENGALLRFVKCAAGQLTIDAADSDKIADSGAGDTIYNDVAAQTYATISLEYVHSIVTWVVTGAHGTWTTTD